MHHTTHTVFSPPVNASESGSIPAPALLVPVVELLQVPPPLRYSPLFLQFTEPSGFWLRVHPDGSLPSVLVGLRWVYRS